MKAKAVLIAFVLIMLIISGIYAGQNDTGQFLYPQRDYVPNEVIVRFKDEKKAALNAFLSRYRTEEIEKVFSSGKKGMGSSHLENVYRIILTEDVDVEKICHEMSKQPNVVYAEPNYVGHFCSTFPNDLSFSNQWALHNTGQTGGVADADVDAPEAWGDETGNENVVIAVIDTGIDYNHPDLAANIWHNPGETADNGIDDDSNGYVDDVTGWDFVSVPDSYVHEDEDPGPGDNDPLDRHGHGTNLAGIIAAVGNNGLGISGMTWQCKLMPVRMGYRRTDNTAGCSSSDAASAIEYAAENSADVINLAWIFRSGPQVVRDAIEYAYARGAVIVASVGNDDSETIVFPSSMDEVISVAGSDDKDNRAVWKLCQPPLPGEGSNYGIGIDVAAPGMDILTTALGSSYVNVHGTSASAGLTSGLAGLILSQDTSFTNQRVKEIIYSSADANISPDQYIGRARINAGNALKIHAVPCAEIDNIDDMDVISGTFPILGTADGRNNPLQNYVLEYGPGVYPVTLTTIVDSTSPVNNGNLASWDLEGVDEGKYTLRLTVHDTCGNYNIKEKVVLVDKDLHPGWPQSTGANNYCHPVAGNLDTDGDLEIVVGDCDGFLYAWKHDGSLVFQKVLDGRVSTGPVLADIDNDGDLEILVASQGSFSTAGKVYLFEADGSSVSGWPQVLPGEERLALSVGDLDGNGSLEVVGAVSWNSMAQRSLIYIWNANGTSYMPAAWPKEIDLEMPPNTGTAQDFANTPVLVDMDNDGDLEIIASFPVYERGPLYVWHHDGTNFSNWPIDTGDGYTVHCVAGDIDNDGDLEIVGIKQNGKIRVWNHDATPYLPGAWPDLSYSFSTPILADLDQDKDLEIIVESNNNNVYVYHHDGQDMAGWPVQVEDILGDWSWPPLVAGDVDGDGCPEIVAAGGKEKRVYIWHSDGTPLEGWPKAFPDKFIGASPVIGDLDNDGKVELFVSSSALCALWDLEGEHNPQSIEWAMFQHDARHTGVYCIPCNGDFDHDGDVDGSDLASVSETTPADIASFAADFGRTNCPVCE